MKSVKYIILSVSACMALASCEDFLTKTPPADLESSTYFSDGASLELYAN